MISAENVAGGGAGTAKSRQSNRSGGRRDTGGVLWGVGGFCLGAVATFLFAWLAFWSPMQKSIAARERSAQQWEDWHRIELQTIQDMKKLSTEEMRSWVSAVNEQSTRFADVERQLHRQEVEMAGPGTTYVAIAAGVAIVGLALIVLMFRDANLHAATTLDNIAALGPVQMITVARGSVHDRQIGDLGVVEGRVIEAASPPRKQLDDLTRSSGQHAAERPLVACPHCGCQVRPDRMDSHIRKIHPAAGKPSA